MYLLLVVLLLTVLSCQTKYINQLPCTVVVADADIFADCTDVSDFSQITSSLLNLGKRVGVLGIDKSPRLQLRREDFSKPEYRNVYQLLIVRCNLRSLNPELFQGMTYLTILNLSENNITSIDVSSFTGLNNLRNLFLTANQIDTISVGTFENVRDLEAIYLGHNRLRSIESGALGGLVKLKTISLGYNSLTYISEYMFSELELLEEIEAPFNKITFIHRNAFKNNPNLQTLNLMGNRLDTLDSRTFVNNHRLLYLFLSYNNMANLGNFPLHINSLETIGLANCKISSIPSGYFSRLPNLEYVYLGGNYLDGIQVDRFKADQKVTYYF